MQVKTKNRNLSITFQYDKNVNQNRITTCTIKDITNGEKFNEARTLASATVVKSNKDSDIKFNARKYALKNCLQVNSLFSKEDRSDIWNQYLSTVNIPKQ